MVLAKLLILVEVSPGVYGAGIPALFNPNQLTIQKSANWRSVPQTGKDISESQFTHGEPATLSLYLFFDTYDTQTDVRLLTRPFFHLTTVEKHGHMHRPPLCLLQWGLNNFDLAQWLLQSLIQKFSLFLETGIPVRATLSCTFKQWRSSIIEDLLLNLQSADVPKTHVVKDGDTLSNIAAKEYNDPRQWRAIATANNLNNPLDLKSGQVLRLPVLTTRRSRRV